MTARRRKAGGVEGGLEMELLLFALLVFFVSVILVVARKKKQQLAATVRQQSGLGGTPASETSSSGTFRDRFARTANHRVLSERQKQLKSRLPAASHRHAPVAVTIACSQLLSKTSEAGGYILDEEELEVVKDLACVANVYLIFQIKKEDVEGVRTLVTHSALLNHSDEPFGLTEHRILFCTSRAGKMAFVRQLEPLLHVEDDEGVAMQLQRFVPSMVLLSPQAGLDQNPHTFKVESSLSSFFGLMDNDAADGIQASSGADISLKLSSEGASNAPNINDKEDGGLRIEDKKIR